MSNKLDKLLKEKKALKGFRESDLLIQYLDVNNNDVQLNAKQKLKLEIYHYIHGLKMRFQRNSQIIGCLLDKYKEHYDADQRKAQRDITETEYIFGSVFKVNKMFEISIMLEACKLNIDMAKTKQDLKALSAAIEAEVKVLKLIPDPSDEFDYSQLEPHTYNFVIEKVSEKILRKLAEGGSLDLNNLMPEKDLHKLFTDAEDIEFTEEK